MKQKDFSTNARKEEKFYNALKDIFVGAKIEGESGYINLMKIKTRYYEKGVFPKLQKDIEEALKPFPEFKEELFDKLYTFFSRYFSESGSIYFRYTPIHQNVYEKVYTDDKDVILFWKTHMLYYIKTDRLFKNLEVEIDGFKFFFDVSTLEHKKAFEKREIIYKFKERKDDGVIVFNVFYKEGNKKTNIEEILKAIKKEGIKISEDTLERAFKTFEKQSEVDYFINKNAKEFLKEQFNLWLYQYVFSGESEWTEKRIKQLQVLKDIAFKIIDFISQFEDELVKIWNKPKFVLNSNYVITLDRIADKKGGITLIEKILKHRNIEEQIKEWKDLGIVEDDFDENEILENKLTGKQLNEKYKFLPIDTKYFKDLELEILGLFDELDKSLDGWLIKSENYQALNTILPKFKERIQTIYIDPPYNTEKDEFIYKDRYQHSSWLTMMENRLSLARKFMREDGVIFVSIDDNEVDNLSKILKDKFSVFVPLHWRRNKTPQLASKTVATRMEYVLYASPSEVKLIRERQSKTRPLFKFDGREIRIFELPEGIKVECDEFKKGTIYAKRNKRNYIEVLDDPIVENGILKNKVKVKGPWCKIDEELEKVFEKRLVFINSSGFPTEILSEEEFEKPVVMTNELIIEGCYNETAFEELTQQLFNFESSFVEKLRPKPTMLPYTLINSVSSLKEDSIILDFFAGSGTTAHAVMKLNKEDGGKRKFLLVEMADYFYDIIIPRLKKIAYSLNWKDGKPQNTDGIGIFFKYYELEQYEDTLRKAKYEDSDFFDNPYEDPYNQYIFMKDLKMLEALEIDYENNKVKVDLSKLYENIDIPETLSNLLGKWIKKITSDYVEFEDGEKIDIKNLDYKLIKPLIWW